MRDAGELMNASVGDRARLRPLGKTSLWVSALGIGTNKWSYGKNDRAVFETYRTVQDHGLNFFDTAEVYGFGKSERLLGDCIRRDRRPAVVASKFAPFIARSGPRHLLKALDASLARLGLTTIDLYFIHFPFPFTNLKALAAAMAEAVRAGKVRHVGVSNFSADQMRRIADALSSSGIPLAANEVQYSLRARKPESNGVLAACRELGASLIAYFPLGMGRLARTAAAENVLQKTVAEIAEEHSVSRSQVALNWLLAKDPCVIPIPGATQAKNAQQNIAALDWQLSAAEVTALDEASALAGR